MGSAGSFRSVEEAPPPTGDFNLYNVYSNGLLVTVVAAAADARQNRRLEATRKGKAVDRVLQAQAVLPPLVLITRNYRGVIPKMVPCRSLRRGLEFSIIVENTSALVQIKSSQVTGSSCLCRALFFSERM